MSRFFISSRNESSITISNNLQSVFVDFTFIIKADYIAKDRRVVYYMSPEMEGFFLEGDIADVFYAKFLEYHNSNYVDFRKN